jgi:hypothetical protein
MHIASQSDGSPAAISQGFPRWGSRLISQFGGHHHSDDQYQDNAERQQGPQHLISPEAVFSPRPWTAGQKRLTLNRKKSQS